MQPIFWLLIYLSLAALVSLVAAKKGRKGWAFFVVLLILPIPSMLLVSYSLGDAVEKKPFAMWLVAFACPAVGLIAALMSNSAQEQAIEAGAYGDYKKCPFCAESVRKEAKKCKHCHSSLDPSTA